MTRARIGTSCRSILFVLAAIACLGAPGPAAASMSTVAPPGNDAFAHAKAITGFPFTRSIDLRGATKQAGEPQGCHQPVGHTAWYLFTPVTGGTIGFDSYGSDFATVITVYRGTSLSALTVVTCSPGPAWTGSDVVFRATAGRTYYIQVGGSGTARGSLVVRAVRVKRPTNDLPAGAIKVSTMHGYRHGQDTRGATAVSEPTPSCGSVSHTVWFRLTPGSTAEVAADTYGSTLTAIIAVYRGSALAPVACGSNAVHFNATKGTTYSFQIGVSGSGQMGHLRFELPEGDRASCVEQGRSPVEAVSWWTTGGAAAAFNSLLDTMAKLQPDLCAYNTALELGMGNLARARLKLLILGGYPPDTFQVHAGHELLDQFVNVPAPGPYLAPLGTSVIDPADFPAGLMKIVSGADGTIYAVPLDIHRANMLWYNKAVFAANGITRAPLTWVEFEADAQALKAAGITPLALGDNGIWAAGMIFETALIAQLGADGFLGLWIGDTEWAGPKVTNALKTLKMVLGYVNADHASLTWYQANQAVIDGTAAMTVMGDWALGDYIAEGFTGYGWAPAPKNGSVYQAVFDTFVLPKKAHDPASAEAFLAFLATAAAQDAVNPAKGSIPANIRAGNPPADQPQYTDYQRSAMHEWRSPGTAVVPSMEQGEAANPAWQSAINDALATFVSDRNVASAQAALVKAARGLGPR